MDQEPHRLTVCRCTNIGNSPGQDHFTFGRSFRTHDGGPRDARHQGMGASRQHRPPLAVLGDQNAGAFRRGPKEPRDHPLRKLTDRSDIPRLTHPANANTVLTILLSPHGEFKTARGVGLGDPVRASTHSKNWSIGRILPMCVEAVIRVIPERSEAGSSRTMGDIAPM